MDAPRCRPGQANGSRECAPDDRLRASRDLYRGIYRFAMWQTP